MSDRTRTPSDRPTPPPAAGTGDDPAGRLGEHVGRFAALALRRLERMAADGAAMAEQAMTRQGAAVEAMGAPAGADQRDPDAERSAAGGAPAPDSATARAETIVDGAGAQFGTLAAGLSHQLRRAAALAREEAEDVWAEAQQIHAARRRDSDGGQGDTP